MTVSYSVIKKAGVWTLLSVPGIAILVRYLSDAISYGQSIHETGQWSVGFLVLVLSVTPLRSQFRGQWMRHLVMHRRAIGVASFGYAAMHTGFYLEQKWGSGLILPEGLELWLGTGWLAFFVFVALAITSNDPSVRAMRGGWKRLHRSVYFAAALTFAHWLLATFNLTLAYVSLAVLLAIQMLRFRRGRSPAH